MGFLILLVVTFPSLELCKRRSVVLHTVEDIYNLRTPAFLYFLTGITILTSTRKDANVGTPSQSSELSTFTPNE